MLDRFDSNYFGWSFARRYYGVYTRCFTSEMRVRRRRYATLVRPLPYSAIAFFLHVSPGMELQPRFAVMQSAIGVIARRNKATMATLAGMTKKKIDKALDESHMNTSKNNSTPPSSSSLL